jgi:L-arabinose isomerase
VDVHNEGLVDTPERALAAGHGFRRADVDVIFLYVTTYAVSSTVLPVVQRAKVPVIVLNLQPTGSIDYTAFNAMGDRTRMTGEWLAYCSACPMPEIASVFNQANIPFHQVTGVLENDPQSFGEIEEWIAAAKAVNGLFHNRMGLMGRYYNGMLDIYTDTTQICASFGGHIEIVEVDEVTETRKSMGRADIDERVRLFHEVFDIRSDCSDAELRRAASTSLALDHMVDAYYYESVPGCDNEDLITSVILGCSLLTGRGVPVAGEYEVKNAVAMKIMDLLGAGGSFTEYYAVDYDDDVVLMGHDGPGHIGIAEGKTKVRPLDVYHGKVGKGLSVEMAVKHGPVTLLSVVQTRDGGVSLLVAEGESVAGPILEIGNTNSRYRFSIGARRFVSEWSSYGPAHHCAVGVGNVASRIEKLGKLLNLPIKRVC